MNSARILFIGNPEFSIPSLNAIASSKNKLIGIVTSTDKYTGRGKKLSETPVSKRAKELNIPLYKPNQIDDKNFLNKIKKLNIDFIIVVAFRFLPNELLEIPKLGSINLHPSLLPKYRGAAPLQWSIINSEILSGITTFLISNKIDKGDILKKTSLVIFPNDDFGSLYLRSSKIGSKLLLKTINKFYKKEIIPRPQNSIKESIAPKINTKNCKINWKSPSIMIKNKISAFSPTPGAFTIYKKKRLKFFKSVPSIKDYKKRYGEIIKINKNSFKVQCEKSSLKIYEIQYEGKKKMKSTDFILGNQLQIGDLLE